MKQVSADEWEVRDAFELHAIRKRCVDKSRLPAELKPNLKKFVYTEPMKDYLACVARDIGIVEADKFYIERAVKQYKLDLPEEQVKEIVTKCFKESQKEGDVAQYIVPFHKCMISSAFGDNLKSKMETMKIQAIVNAL